MKVILVINISVITYLQGQINKNHATIQNNEIYATYLAETDIDIHMREI